MARAQFTFFIDQRKPSIAMAVRNFLLAIAIAGVLRPGM